MIVREVLSVCRILCHHGATWRSFLRRRRRRRRLRLSSSVVLVVLVAVLVIFAEEQSAQLCCNEEETHPTSRPTDGIALTPSKMWCHKVAGRQLQQSQVFWIGESELAVTASAAAAAATATATADSFAASSAAASRRGCTSDTAFRSGMTASEALLLLRLPSLDFWERRSAP